MPEAGSEDTVWARLGLVAKTISVFMGSILLLTGLGEVIVALFFPDQGGQLLMGLAGMGVGLLLVGVPLALGFWDVFAGAASKRRANP